MGTERTELEVNAKGTPATRRELSETAKAAEDFGERTRVAFDKVRRDGDKIPDTAKAVNAAMRDIRAEAADLVAHLGPVGSAFRAVGPAGLAVGVAAGGVTLLAKATFDASRRSAEYADTLDDQSRALQVNVERWQELRFMFATVGVGGDTLFGSLGRLEQRMGKLRTLTDDEAKALRSLDPALTEGLQGAGDVDEALELIADSIARIPDAARGAQIARLLGVQDLLPLLREGSAGLAELAKRGRDAGAIIREDLVEQGAAAADKMDELAFVLEQRTNAALLTFTPTVVSLTEKLFGLGEGFLFAIDKALGLTNLGTIGNLDEQINAFKSLRGVGGRELSDAEIERVKELKRERAALRGEDRADADAAAKRRQQERADARAAATDSRAQAAAEREKRQAREAAEAAGKEAASQQEAAAKKLVALERAVAAAGLDGVNKVAAERADAMLEWQDLLAQG